MGEKLKPLGRDGFLKRAVVREVPLSDGSVVCIRALPASYIIGGAEDRFSAVKLLASSLCDESGALMFAEGEGEQAMTVDGASLKNIMAAIMDLNGLKRSEGEAGEAEKN